MRITRKMLQARVDRLNVVLHRTATAWTKCKVVEDGRIPRMQMRANLGHFLLDSYSPGDGWTRYALVVICSSGGGQSNVSPTCTAQEMWTYLRGVFDVLDSEYTHNFDKHALTPACILVNHDSIKGAR